MAANATQVGGTHYKAVEYQHWDFAVDARLGYLEGQISKYVDRATRKNGRQDLEKAQHFAEKLLEVAKAGRVRVVPAPLAGGLLPRYFAERSDLLDEERAAIFYATCWQDFGDVEVAISAIKHAILLRYPTPEEQA